MSRRQARSTNSVSLFPFLAVLVCAMGALIFLLLVTTRRIRSQSIARAQQSLPVESSVDQAIPEPDPETADPNAELRQAIKQLSVDRDRKRAELDKQQTLFLAARQRLQESRSALDELERRSRWAKLQRKVHNENKQAEIADPAAGTFEQLVKAAEKCPARCIHPGVPRSGDETVTDDLVARAARFN